jgi:hypothetical protein
MANLPKKYNRGERLTAKDVNNLATGIRSNMITGDGKTIKVTRSTGGTTISYIGGEQGGISDSGDGYSGYFLASEKSSNEITIAAGEAVINNKQFTVPEEDFTITESCYIYLFCSYESATLSDDGQETAEGYVDTPILVQSSTKPTYGAGNFFEIICYVTFTTIITDVRQEHHGQANGFILSGLLDAIEEDIQDLLEQGDDGSAAGATQRKIDDAEAENRCNSYTSCDPSRTCKSATRLRLEGVSKAAVDTLISDYETDSELRDAKCADLTGSDGTSCNTDANVWVVQPTTSFDNVTWFAELYLCCCNTIESDEESVIAGECADESAGCTEIDENSSEFVDYNSASEAKTNLLTGVGLDFSCIDNGYLESCGYKSLSITYNSGTGFWDLTWTMCCKTPNGENPENSGGETSGSFSISGVAGAGPGCSKTLGDVASLQNPFAQIATCTITSAVDDGLLVYANNYNGYISGSCSTDSATPATRSFLVDASEAFSMQCIDWYGGSVGGLVTYLFTI